MKQYPLFKVHVDSTLALAHMGEVLNSGFINEGAQVSELTYAMQRRYKTDNVILTNSCTSAITIALKLSGVEHGYDVVSTPMTCVATNTPIVNLGGRIVWADVDPDSGMIDPDDLERRITGHTKAVIVVAWAGTPPSLKRIRSICQKRGVKLIVDAAHAFGATYLGEPMHTWADFTCYSFQAIKHFTTGDGGMLISSDVNDHERAKCLKWFGLNRDKAKDHLGNWRGQQWDVDIEEAGFKFNMNNLSAAIGLAQLDRIDDLITQHRTNAAMYDKLFEGFKAVRHAKRHADSSSFWVYTMKLNPSETSLTRDQLLHRLNARGVAAGIVHVPNDTYTCFSKFRAQLPGVREFSTHQFSLPCGWWLDGHDIIDIYSIVKETLDEHPR